jgi:hypothetical protein
LSASRRFVAIKGVQKKSWSETSTLPAAVHCHSNAMLDHRICQNLDLAPAVEPVSGMDRQALPRELIDQIQHPYRSTINGYMCLRNRMTRLD